MEPEPLPPHHHQRDAAAAAALTPTTPAAPGTLTAAAEVQRLDVAVMHEKALDILAALQEESDDSMLMMM